MISELKNADGIIFDIDGTIWDIRQLVSEAWEAAIKEKTDLPVTFNAEILGSLFGKPMNEIFFNLYPEASEETLDIITPTLYEYEHQYIKERKPAPYANVRETLKKLSEKFKLFVVTNAQKGYVEAMIDATDMEGIFKGWKCYGDTLQSKDVTMKMLIEENNLKNPIYVGDTAGDQDACKKAGVPFIYAEYGLGETDTAKYSIKNMKELEQLL